MAASVARLFFAVRGMLDRGRSHPPFCSVPENYICTEPGAVHLIEL
jgi:hypothetical protein